MTVKHPVILAVCGKGGVGKTSISALLARVLSDDSSKRILVIDADPAVGLSYPLGVHVQKTVDDIRTQLILQLQNGEEASKKELVKDLDYEMFNAMEERDNMAFLAIGRPEGDGCYCQVNALLKDIIREMALNFDYVIIDAEAGVEQVSRRVMEMVSHLLLVSDASLRGRKIIETIYQVAVKKCRIEKAGVIFNKMQNHEEIQFIYKNTGLEVWGAIFENESIRTFDREGRSFFDLPGSNAIDQVRSIVKKHL